MRKPDKATTSKIMASIPSKNTKPELRLGKAMWSMGLRYRKHYPIKGKPDFVFVSAKLAVFCDGDFWHGNNWRIRGMKSFDEELSSYSDFWKNKIVSNMKRDKNVNNLLKEDGWKVLRFWESDVLKSPKECAKVVLAEYDKRYSKSNGLQASRV